MCRSEWPRGLRRGSAAAVLLRLWVRIPPAAWTFVCCEYCVCCQVEVSATSWSLVQRSSTDCGPSLCVIYKPREWGGPGPLEAVEPKTKKVISVQAMKAQPGEWRYSSVNSYPQHKIEVEWSVPSLGRFMTEETAPWYALKKRLGGP